MATNAGARAARNRLHVAQEGNQTRAPLLSVPSYGTVEFWLWVLVLAEMAFLVWHRQIFKGALGG